MCVKFSLLETWILIIDFSISQKTCTCRIMVCDGKTKTWKYEVFMPSFNVIKFYDATWFGIRIKQLVLVKKKKKN